jgi:PAS domain S-box-containing protein
MPELSLEEFFQRTVDLIPPGWQYPEITCSRIELDGSIFCSSNFKESEWNQTSDIMVRGKKSGVLEIYYLEERPESDEGPFLKEERDLIEAISELIGNTINRKQAEEELKQYENIVSSSTDMLALLDKEFVYLAANSAYREGFGLTPDELIGHTVVEVFGTEYFETVIKPNAQRCMLGEQVNFQRWVDFPAYGSRFMDVNYYPYLDRENEMKGFVVSARNITARKKAEEDLGKQQDQLEELVEERTTELQKEIEERVQVEQKLRERTEELEVFNKAMVDREMRIIKLKEETNDLCKALGKDPRYPTVWESPDSSG